MTATTARPQDPICGLIVSEASAHNTKHKGKTIYFCSDHCRKKFIASPEGMQTDQPPDSPNEWRGQELAHT